jgi:hypothetical protein
MPTTHVAGLIDVIVEDEKLNYIDDGIPAETSKKESPALKIVDAKTDSLWEKAKARVKNHIIQLIWIRPRLMNPRQTSPDRRRRC